MTALFMESVRIKCALFNDVFNYRRKEKVKWYVILRRAFQTGGRDPPRGRVMIFRGHRENIRIYIYQFYEEV